VSCLRIAGASSVYLLESLIRLWLGVSLYDSLDLFMLWRLCPFVGIWRFYMMMYIDLMTCIFWRCMTYIRCNCWWILYMHVVRILMLRCSVYFLNIYVIRVYYRFNRNRALHTLLHSSVICVYTRLRRLNLFTLVLENCRKMLVFINLDELCWIVSNGTITSEM